MSEPTLPIWEESYISDHFELLIGGTPSRSNETYWDKQKETKNKWVSIRDLKGRYINDTEERISDIGVKKSNVKLIPEETIIMSFKLTIGRLSITKCPLFTNEAIVSFIPKEPDSVDTDYLYYGLQSWNLLGEVDQAVKGATLNKDKMSRIFGLFPPLPEQQKIASILTSVDEVIEKTQSQINKLQDLKKATMNELLTKGIGHTEFKDSELGRIPKSWEVKKVGELSEVIDPQPDHRTPPSVEYGIPYVGMGDLGENGKIKFENARKVPHEAFDKQLNSFDVHQGAFIFGKIGTIGNPSILPDERSYCLSANVILLTGKNLLIQKFLYFIFMSRIVDAQVADQTNTTSQPALGIKKVRDFSVPLPEEHEIKVITSILLSINENIRTKNRKLQQTQSLKKSLMQDLLTGKVRVQVA